MELAFLLDALDRNLKVAQSLTTVIRITEEHGHPQRHTAMGVLSYHLREALRHVDEIGSHPDYVAALRPSTPPSLNS